MTQVADDRLAHMHGFHLRKFEHEGRSDMRLLERRLAGEEQAGLAVMVRECLGTNALTRAVLLHRRATETAGGIFARRVGLQRTRLVGDAALWHLRLHMTVTLLVGEWALRRIDRQLV